MSKMLRKSKSTAMVTILFMLLMMVLQTGVTEVSAVGTSYYVDSVNGSDSNNGTSTSTPWKTLDKVNSINFVAGDTIYFKAGCTFNGSLIPKSSGTSGTGNRIIFDMYGTGNKPVINATSVADPNHNGVAAVKVYNQEYLEFNNLDITNNPTDPNQSYRVGMLINNNNFGRNLKTIVVNNCNIHDIAQYRTFNSSMKEYPIGGISIFHNGANSAFDYLVIQNVTMSNVANSGIYEMNYNWDTKTWNPDGSTCARSSQVTVKNVSVSNVKTNGIVIGHTDGALIDSCLVNSFAKANCAAIGIWIHNTNNSTIQNCESTGGVVPDYDSEGFDLDMRVIDSKIQYNYSHDNAGGFLLATSTSAGNAVRYNISQNDQRVLFSSQVATNWYYNNTCYIGEGLTTKVWGLSGASGYFYNNIIESHGITKYKDSTTVVDATNHNNNCYNGVTFAAGVFNETKSITENPMLVGGGTGGLGISTLSGYKLQAGSPCINKGKNITDNGDRDFFAENVGATTDIGADEYGNPRLGDTFEDGEYTNNPTWTVVNGSWSIITDGTKVLKQASTSGEGLIIAGDTVWTDYTVEGKVKLYSNTGSPSTTALLGRYTDSTHYYMLRLDTTNNKIQLLRRSGTNYPILQEADFTASLNTFYKLTFKIYDSNIKGYINDQLYIDIVDATFPAGCVGVRTTSQSAAVDDFEVR